MQDRYLFRGKRLDNGEWITGYYDYHEAIERHLITKNGRVFEVSSATIGQCTGLHAAKSYRGESEADRLVFEGDMVRKIIPGNATGIVVWDSEFLQYRIDRGEYSYNFVTQYHSNFEIIGNIHNRTEGEE